MFRVVVNGLLIGQRRIYGDAKELALEALRDYVKSPVITIESAIGEVIEIVK